MTVITIIMTVLAAAAAIFAVMFFRDRKDAKKYESKAESLSKELGDLKCELARRENSEGDAMTPLSRENIEEFLKREKSADIEISEDQSSIMFAVKDERYLIDCRRLPQQFIICKGYDRTNDSSIRWDIFDRASVEISESLVMVKMNVTHDGWYGFMIVSTTHTIAGLREDYDFFMALIADAERMVWEAYRKMVEAEYPEECVDENQESESSDAEDLVTLMTNLTSGRKKIQS